MAGGRAFTFRYTETEELLRAAGCRVETFDPLVDTSLPEGTSGIYLGGGFPEVHAPGLSENAPLRAELHAAIEAGVPTVAECAGLLYLCQSVDDAVMVGSLPATARMTPRLTLSYPSVTAPADSLLTREGETVTGHEFHRTHVEPAAGDSRPGPSTRCRWVSRARPCMRRTSTCTGRVIPCSRSGSPMRRTPFRWLSSERSERLETTLRPVVSRSLAGAHCSTN